MEIGKSVSSSVLNSVLDVRASAYNSLLFSVSCETFQRLQISVRVLVIVVIYPIWSSITKLEL